MERDHRENDVELKSLGFKVIRFWENDVKKPK